LSGTIPTISDYLRNRFQVEQRDGLIDMEDYRRIVEELYTKK